MTVPSYVGRFEVRDEIATGGFALVLRAWDEELESFVALKILHRELARDGDVETRFSRGSASAPAHPLAQRDHGA